MSLRKGLVRLDPHLAELDNSTLEQLFYFIINMDLSIGWVRDGESNDFSSFLQGLTNRDQLKGWINRQCINAVGLDAGADFKNFRAGNYESFFSCSESELVATTQTCFDQFKSSSPLPNVTFEESIATYEDSELKTYIGAGKSCEEAKISALATCWNKPFRIKHDNESVQQITEICRAFAKVNPAIRIYDKELVTTFLRRVRNRGKKQKNMADLLDGKDLLEILLSSPGLERLEIITKVDLGRDKGYSEEQKDEAVVMIHELLKEHKQESGNLILLNKGSDHPTTDSFLYGSSSCFEWPHFSVCFTPTANSRIRAVATDIYQQKLEIDRRKRVKILQERVDYYD